MTPEHLPTEQYEAQLAEKVVRLQTMMAPFAAPSFVCGTMATICTILFSISRPGRGFALTASRPPAR